MISKQNEKFWKFIMMDDLDFYEEYILELPDDQQEAFFKEFPDFMSDFPLWDGRIDLLRDRAYRGILRKIKRYEKTNHGYDIQREETHDPKEHKCIDNQQPKTE